MELNVVTIADNGWTKTLRYFSKNKQMGTGRETGG